MKYHAESCDACAAMNNAIEEEMQRRDMTCSAQQIGYSFKIKVL